MRNKRAKRGKGWELLFCKTADREAADRVRLCCVGRRGKQAYRKEEKEEVLGRAGRCTWMTFENGAISVIIFFGLKSKRRRRKKNGVEGRMGARNGLIRNISLFVQDMPFEFL